MQPRLLQQYVLVFSLLMVLVTMSCHGQYYPVKKYTEMDGLAHSTVFRVMQDKLGFLFFSTDNGLSVFNGKSFANYASPGQQSVMSVAELNNGDKLISTLGGISLFRHDSIIACKMKYGKLPDKIIYTQEDDARTWVISAVGQSGELYCIEKDTVRQVDLKNKKGEYIHILKMKKDERTGIIFCTSEGLYTSKNGQPLQPFLNKIIKEPVYDVIRSGDDFWVGMQDGVIHTDQKTIIKRYQPGDHSGVSDLLLDHEQNLWIIMPRLRIGIIHHGVYTDISKKLPLNNIIINDIFEDHENNIWIATQGDGIYRLGSPDMQLFFPEKDKLSFYARTLVPYKNELLVGSFGSVSILRENEINQYRVRLLNYTDFIYFLRVVHNDLYIGIPRGIIKKDIVSGKELFIDCGGGVSFCPSTNGTLWAGGFNSLGILQNNKWVKADLAALDNRKITAIFEDGQQRLWIGTDSGIYVLDNGACHKVFTGTISNTKYINSITGDMRGNLFFAANEGLIWRKNNDWRIMTAAEGLGSNKCNSITEGDNQALWIGTQKGLNRLEVATGKITEHPTGLYPYEILSLRAGDSGVLTVGTVNGICRMQQQTDEITLKSPPVYITTVSAGNKVIPYPERVETGTVNSKIIIEYIGLSFRYPQNVEYRYRITQAGSSWKATRNTSIELPLLAPGEYSFELQARLNGGNWGETVHLGISIPRPFWKSWWFVVICLFFLTVLLLIITRVWLIQKQRKYQVGISIQEKMNHLRQQALTTLINPHFIFNCLNSIQYFINRNDKDEAGKYMTRFARLIRLTLEHAQETYITLADETERISLYLELEKLRCGDLLRYEIHIAPILQTQDVLIPNMIVQPYVENAIWHGIMPKQVPGTLKISIAPSGNDTLKIFIDDDGIGISHAAHNMEKDRNHLSFGMSLTRERMELMSQSVHMAHHVTVTDKYDLNLQTTGTLVEISIPFRQQ